MVRHFPRADGAGTAGIAANFRADLLRVAYVPAPGAEQDLGKIRNLWAPPLPPEPRPLGLDRGLDRFRLARRPDGVVAFATAGPPDGLADWKLWAACYLEGHDLSSFGTPH